MKSAVRLGWLAICELGLGRFESGWRNYEARWDANSIVLFGRRNLSKKLITSKPRFRRGVGGRVLLWSEQGVGDEIMFASMISDFRKQCDDLLVEVDTRLLPIFERSFPQIQCVPRFSKIPESLYDYQLPIGSLGEIVRPSLSSFEKSQASYLSPDLNLVDDFKRKLGESTRAVVGLSWWSKNPDSGAGRSVPLTPLLWAMSMSWKEQLRYLMKSFSPLVLIPPSNTCFLWKIGCIGPSKPWSIFPMPKYYHLMD